MLLQAEKLSKRFGGLVAVRNYNLNLPEKSIYGLIGPNGAGKTTIINILTGVIKPDTGRVLFDGVDITGKRPDEVAGFGIARTFQNLRLFKKMTVEENIQVSAQFKHSYSMHHSILGLRRYREAEDNIFEESRRLMELLGIERFGKYLPTELPYGIQKRVEIGRALALKPRILLLDEPASGMTNQEARELSETLKEIRRERGISMLIVEHRVPLVMDLCNYIQVMNQGEIIAEGLPEEIRINEEVIRVYLRSGIS
ncbi:MAG: ABC transporter ATP-binding protein [Candidatus Caldarchaeales archaeon]